jgi:uncharacterized protein
VSIVSNTGPLIALSKVDQLDLLKHLFGEVYIPPAVHRELLANTGPEAARLNDAFLTFIRVAERPQLTPEVEAAIFRLDLGEQEAVALAHEMHLLLLLDDRMGRQAARRLNVSFTGVAGVLIRAKEVGLLPLVRPILEQIRARGYWLSDQLVDIAAHLAGESASAEHP